MNLKEQSQRVKMITWGQMFEEFMALPQDDIHRHKLAKKLVRLSPSTAQQSPRHFAAEFVKHSDYKSVAFLINNPLEHFNPVMVAYVCAKESATRMKKDPSCANKDTSFLKHVVDLFDEETLFKEAAYQVVETLVEAQLFFQALGLVEHAAQSLGDPMEKTFRWILPGCIRNIPMFTNEWSAQNALVLQALDDIVEKNDDRLKVLPMLEAHRDKQEMLEEVKVNEKIRKSKSTPKM